MKSQHFELQIDELVLDGFDVADHQQLGLALQNELQRLFSEQGIPASFGKNTRLTDLDGGTIDVVNSSPEIIGSHAAGRIYQGLHHTASQSTTSTNETRTITGKSR